MRIRDDILKCVFFISIRTHDGQFVHIGTGFSIAKAAPGARIESHPQAGVGMMKMFSYAVTAKHVIEGAKRKGATEVWFRLNRNGGGIAYISYAIDSFMLHPEADIAVIATPNVGQHDHLAWHIDECVTADAMVKHNIGAGSSLAIVGLFHHHFGQSRNLPIVRTGNIAAMPSEPVGTAMGPMEAVLIEARSIGGLSGSPVFANTGQVRVGAAGQIETTKLPHILLLGLMHGHYDEVGEPGTDRARVNVGIGIVVPVSKLIEFLKTPPFLEAEAAALARALP